MSDTEEDVGYFRPALAALLRLHAEEHSIDQKEIAKALNCAQSTVSRLLAAKPTGITVDLLLFSARFLNLSMGELHDSVQSIAALANSLGASELPIAYRYFLAAAEFRAEELRHMAAGKRVLGKLKP